MVMRFDPFHDVDRLAEQLWGQTRRQGARSFPMDAYRRGDHFYLHFDLPGVSPDDIELTGEQNVLSVRAERRYRREPEDEVIVGERPEGTFTRQVFLGETLDTDQIEARYDQGVLTLRIPVKEAAKPRRIDIGKTTQGPEPIEGVSERKENEEA